MKALIGVSSLTDVALPSVISEMERLAEAVMRENGFALTECEHGVHADDPCDICDPESALEAQQQAESCSDMDIFHRY